MPYLGSAPQSLALRTAAGGGRATIRLSLNKAQRRRLRRSGKPALRLTAVVVDPAGNRRTIVRRVRLVS